MKYLEDLQKKLKILVFRQMRLYFEDEFLNLNELHHKKMV